MRLSYRKVLLVAVSAAMVVALLPAGAVARTPVRAAGIGKATTANKVLSARAEAPDRQLPMAGPGKLRRGVSAQAGATATADAYEAGAGDDTSGTARDITAMVPNMVNNLPSESPYTEAHTFDKANNTDGGDEDWFRIWVDEEDIFYGVALLIEAFCTDGGVDPVVEVYGPGAFSATAPPSLPELVIDSDPTGVTDTDPRAKAASDDNPWFFAKRSSVQLSFDPDSPKQGWYYVRIRPYYQGNFGQSAPPVGYNDGAGAYTLRVKNGLALRLAGQSRFQTSVRISKERFADGELAGGFCIVASGMNFPDALAGSTLAGVTGGPILLTPPSSLDSNVSAEIQRLGVSHVYVLGGPAAISESVLNAIDALPGVTGERVAGGGRYATARAIANTADALLKSVEPTWGVAPLAFVVNGTKFPDALAASPMATWNAAPILLTQATVLDPSVTAAITELGVTDVVIVGGTAVVSSGVESQLKTILGSTRVKRITASGGRYGTATAFATWASNLNGDAGDPHMVGTTGNPDALWRLIPDEVGLASGVNFPDALAGGVLCGYRAAPILLTLPYDLRIEVLEYWDNLDWTYWKSYVFGGTAAVDDFTFWLFDLFTTPSWLGVIED